MCTRFCAPAGEGPLDDGPLLDARIPLGGDDAAADDVDGLVAAPLPTDETRPSAVDGRFGSAVEEGVRVAGWGWG